MADDALYFRHHVIASPPVRAARSLQEETRESSQDHWSRMKQIQALISDSWAGWIKQSQWPREHKGLLGVCGVRAITSIFLLCWLPWSYSRKSYRTDSSALILYRCWPREPEVLWVHLSLFLACPAFGSSSLCGLRPAETQSHLRTLRLYAISPFRASHSTNELISTISSVVAPWMHVLDIY